MKHKHKYNHNILLLSAIAGIAFFLFSLLVKENLFNQFDPLVTITIQNMIPKNYDPFLSLLSLGGSFEIIILFLIILLIKYKKASSFFVIFMFGVAHVIEVLGKSLFTHPGPPAIFFRYTIPFLFPTSLIPKYAGIEHSYPSGHSLRMVFLATVAVSLLFSSRLSRFKKIILSILLVIVTALMLISRISLGEHWISDVIGGSLLGLAFGLLSVSLL